MESDTLVEFGQRFLLWFQNGRYGDSVSDVLIQVLEHWRFCGGASGSEAALSVNLADVKKRSHSCSSVAINNFLYECRLEIDSKSILSLCVYVSSVYFDCAIQSKWPVRPLVNGKF